MKIMKLISALLAIASAAIISTTAHAQTNLVINPGFETGVFSSPWIGTTGDVAISSTNQHSGNYCVAVSSTSLGHGTCLQEIHNLTANTTYQFTGYGMLGTATAGSIKVDSYGGSTINVPLTGTGYNKVSFQFTTGSTNTTAVIYIGNNGLSGTLYGDDFFVGNTFPLSDPSDTGNWFNNSNFWDEFTNDTTFNTTLWATGTSLGAEPGIAGYWTGSNHSPVQYDPANVGIATLGDGTKCLDLKTINWDNLTNGNFEADLVGDTTLIGWTSVGVGSVSATSDFLPNSWTISGNADGYYIGASLTQGTGAPMEIEQTFPVLPSTQYQMTANLKVGTVGTTPQVTMGLVSPVKTAIVTSTTWGTQTFAFTTGSTQTTATIYIENSGGANSVAYCDNVSVVPTHLPAPDGEQMTPGNYITTAAVWSNAMAGYGYYEVMMQPTNAASSSSFWFQSHDPVIGIEEELDVAEEVGQPSEYASTYYTNGETIGWYPEYMRINAHYFFHTNGGNGWNDSDLGAGSSYKGYTGQYVDEAFHAYGVDWEPGTISFYYDGTLLRTITQVVPPLVPTGNQQAQVTLLQRLIFDTEVFPEYGIPVGGSSSDFLIKYVRAWTHGPVVNSTLTATGTHGSPFSYTITGTGSPTSYGATGQPLLPAGLTVNTSTGVISGTPTTAGTSTVTIWATNATGSGSASLVLTIN